MDAASGPRPIRLIPALGPIYDALTPYTYPLIRFVAGAFLIPHGWAKIVGGQVTQTAQGMAKMGLEPATFFAWYIGCLELFGGVLLAVGLLTRVVAAQVVGFMMVATFFVHWGNGFFWPKGGYEYPLFWGMVALVIAIRGGGALSIDSKIGREI